MALALRDHYDVGTRVADDPVVQVIDAFADPAECEHIIDLSIDHLDTALVSAVGAATTSAGRTGSVAWIAHDRSAVVGSVVERVAALVGLPVSHAESLQVVHYGPNEEYRPHFDGYDLDTEKGRQRTEHGGQRIVTALLYLQDVDDGGATVFPRLGIEVRTQTGRLVVFHDIGDHSLTDLTRHPASLHGSQPVRSGEKWACNLWFRQFPYRPT